MVNDFPLAAYVALKEVAAEYNLKLKEETHYEAINRELEWFENNKRYRLDFNLDKNVSRIVIAYYIDTFPIFLGRALVWCHNFIPGFPYCAKITWQKLAELSVDLSPTEYREKIKFYLHQTKRSSEKPRKPRGVPI